MPIAPVLQRFFDDELSRTPALTERVLAGCLRRLRDTGESRLTATERATQFTLADALQMHGAAYQRAFTIALQIGVRAALGEHDGSPLAGPPPPIDDAELMDESRAEIDIEIARAVQLIETTAEWELRELQSLTSTLTGQTQVGAESRPPFPMVYGTALWEAACAVSTLQVQRTTLLRVSAGVAAGLLKNAWAAASTRLESQGLEPGIYRSAPIAPRATPWRGQPNEEVTRPDVMAAILASMPDAFRGTTLDIGLDIDGASAAIGASPSIVPAPDAFANRKLAKALARLDEVLRHVPQVTVQSSHGQAATTLVKRLNLHRTALLASSALPVERQTIEMLSRLFDAMLFDPQLPPAFAAMLARLQASVMRVGLHDPALLASARHDVWRLIDSIGEAAAAYPQPNDTRAAALLNFCRRLTEPLARAAAPDAALYRRAQSQLDAFMADQFQTQRRAAQPVRQALQLDERREVLQQLLALRLVEQMAPMRTSPGIRRFITGAWARVLAESMLRAGEQGDETRGYFKLVDELLWSVQLHEGPQSRQRLIGLLPGLMRQLRAGMALIDLAQAEQDSVLEELTAIHSEALRPGVRDEAAALTPAQIVQRMRDEVLPPATGQGGFGDSVIDLGSMEIEPAQLTLDSPTDEPVKRVQGLREAERLRLFLHGRWECVQLLWRSDQGLFFVFAGETGARTHSATQRALQKLAAAGLLQPLQTRSLVQRALDGVARELGCSS